MESGLELSVRKVKDTLQVYFYDVKRCSRLRIWVVCLIYFKFTRISSIVYHRSETIFGNKMSL